MANYESNAFFFFVINFSKFFIINVVFIIKNKHPFFVASEIVLRKSSCQAVLRGGGKKIKMTEPQFERIV